MKPWLQSLRVSRHRAWNRTSCRPTIVSTDAGPSIWRFLNKGTRTRDTLPLPPIMDINVIEAKDRHMVPKLHVDKNNLTEFQKRLYANAHAHALATPLRQCSYSITRLPRQFLLSFNIKNHPETGNPWLAPTALLPKDQRGPRAGPTSRILLRNVLLRLLESKGKRGLQLSLEPNLKKHLGPRLSKMVIREDMHDFVRGLLCRQVTRKLRWLLEHFDGQRIVQLPSKIPEISDIENVACVLQLRPLHSPAFRELSMLVHTSADDIITQIHPQFDKIRNWHAGRAQQLKQKPHPPSVLPAPPLEVDSRKLEFPTLEYRPQHAVPLFNLHEMLGNGMVDTLTRCTTYENTTWIVIKAHPLNIQLELMMMKLQGYLADLRL